MDLLHVRLETKANPDLAVGQFEGLGSVFGNVDMGNDIVAAGAFKATLAAHKKAGTMPSMFASHDPHTPIGEWLEMSEGPEGLYVKGQLWVAGVPDRTPVAAAEMYHNQMKSRGISGLSIGYMVDDSEEKMIKGATVRVIKACSLVEVSPTTFPMNPKALTTRVKGLDLTHVLDVRETERFLRDAGMSRSRAKAMVAQGYRLLRDAGDRKACEEPDRRAAIVAALKSLAVQ